MISPGMLLHEFSNYIGCSLMHRNVRPQEKGLRNVVIKGSQLDSERFEESRSRHIRIHCLIFRSRG